MIYSNISEITNPFQLTNVSENTEALGQAIFPISNQIASTTADFLQEHYIATAATIAGLIAGGRSGIRTVQRETFPMEMVAAASLMHGTRAFLGVTGILTCGDALLSAAMDSDRWNTYVSKTALSIIKHPSRSTAATVGGLAGAYWANNAFAKWHLPNHVITQASIGFGILSSTGITIAKMTADHFEIKSKIAATAQCIWNNSYLASALNGPFFTIRTLTFHLLDAYLATTLGIIDVSMNLLDAFKTATLSARASIASIHPAQSNTTQI